MFEVRSLGMPDYPAVRALWEGSDGVGLSSADTPEATAVFLARNPGLSLVALSDSQVQGAILAGHDGRRGYLHHLVVAPAVRGRGLGRRLVTEALRRLGAAGIEKCHLFVFETNAGGRGFWTATGAQHRDELRVYSLRT